MKVFVVVGFLQTTNCDFSYDVIGLYTSFEKAQSVMKMCHNNYVSMIDEWEYCVIKDRFIDDNQCFLIYEHRENVERHFVVIQEREVEE